MGYSDHCRSDHQDLYWIGQDEDDCEEVMWPRSSPVLPEIGDTCSVREGRGGEGRGGVTESYVTTSVEHCAPWRSMEVFASVRIFAYVLLDVFYVGRETKMSTSLHLLYVWRYLANPVRGHVCCTKTSKTP